VKYVLHGLGLDRSQNVRSEGRNRVKSVVAIPAEVSWR
jgi:hypothetical protein